MTDTPQVTEAMIEAGMKKVFNRGDERDNGPMVKRIYLAMTAAREPDPDIAKQIGKLLANDPVCGGRVTRDTVDAIARLVMAREPVAAQTGGGAAQPLSDGNTDNG